MKKILTMMLTVVFCFTAVLPGFAAAAVPQTAPEKLAVVEKYLYGTEQAGALVSRVEGIETDVYGKKTNDAILARVDNIYNYLTGNGDDVYPSFSTKLNAVEWQFTQVMSDAPAKTRIEQVEIMLEGQAKTNSPLASRLEALVAMAYTDSAIEIRQTVLPKDSLVKIEFTKELRSKDNRAGDDVAFKAADNLYVNDVLVLPKGAVGHGTIKKVVQPSSFGRDARIDVEFSNVTAIDGTQISIFVGDLAKQEAETAAGAAGASIGGMILLGPIGALGGAFVTGKSVVIPAGTTTFVQVVEDTPIKGIVQPVVS